MKDQNIFPAAVDSSSLSAANHLRSKQNSGPKPKSPHQQFILFNGALNYKRLFKKVKFFLKINLKVIYRLENGFPSQAQDTRNTTGHFPKKKARENRCESQGTCQNLGIYDGGLSDAAKGSGLCSRRPEKTRQSKKILSDGSTSSQPADHQPPLLIACDRNSAVIN